MKMKIAIIVCLVIIVGIGVAMFTGVCGGGSISFTLQLDGKPLPASAQPEVSIDGKPYTPGEAIRPGSHNLTVKLSNASPFGKSFRVIWGDLNFGPLPLSTLKCELNIAVEPSPASIVLRQGTEQIESGHSPATFSIPAGSYVVEVMRGEYSEYKPIDVLANSKTNLNILLNLGGVALSSDPDDAEFKLAGNGHLWQGSLPTNIVDVPTGNYSLVARRKGWEINSDVAVNRGVVLTNRTEFTYGSITVTSDPTSLTISTNAVVVGKSPVAISEVRPGSYTLTATDGESDLQTNIDIGPRENIMQKFVFHYSAVTLDSSPSGATVLRRGQAAGKTPITMEHMAVGQTAVGLRLEGYAFTNYLVTASKGATNYFAVRLTNEKYLENLAKARYAATEVPPNYRLVLTYINQALQISPDETEAIQFKNEYEYMDLTNTALHSYEKSDLTIALADINKALNLRPDSVEAGALKSKITAAKVASDRLATAAAQKSSAERILKAEQDFNQAVAGIVQEHRGQTLIAAVYSYPVAVWKLHADTAEIKAALFRAVEKTTPKWRSESEQSPSSDTILYYLRAKLLLGSSLYHLLIQTCELPNQDVDIRATMILDVITDQDPNYPERQRQLNVREYRDFYSWFDSELKTVPTKVATAPVLEQIKTDSSNDEIGNTLEKAIIAKGGREVLKRFEVSKTVSTTFGTTKGRQFSMREMTCLQLPDKLRVDQRASVNGKDTDPITIYILGNQSRTIVNPALGFIPKKMSPESEAGQRLGLYLSSCALLTPLLGADYRLEKAIAPQEGVTALKVHKAGKPDVTLIFEQVKGALVGLAYEKTIKDGRAFQATFSYSDFQNFSGFVAPRTIKYIDSSGIETTTTVESIEPLESFPRPPMQLD